MKTELVLWDWNGTLLDDLSLCVYALNRLLAIHGYPQRYDRAEYLEIFGFPVQDYYRRAGFDFDRHSFALLAKRYMDHYVPASRVCPVSEGGRETLQAVRAMGLRQVVLSASRIETLTQQVEQRGLRGWFDELLGLGDIYAKSKVELGRGWMAAQGLDPARAVMVGDTVHDAEVAAAMGTRCVLYAGGHQARHILEATGLPVIDRLEELPGLLEKI